MVETTAVKGWSIAELGTRSGVARSTVYGWRDNPGRPQAKSVNAVADVLGIPRDRALRLAGIIGTTPGKEPNPTIPKTLLRAIESEDDLTPEVRQAVIDAVTETIRESGASEPSGKESG